MVCSLKDPTNDHGWSRAVVTFPEGADHPVVLGRAGDCGTCLIDLHKEGEAYPFPTNVIPVIGIEAKTGEFCQCPPCQLIRSAKEAKR